MCRLLLLSLLLSCASAGTATVKDVPAAEGDQPAGAAGGDDLARAFDPEQEKTRPVIVRPVEAPPVDLAAGFKAALAEGQAALKARQLDAARTAAATAVKEAASLDGEAHQGHIRPAHGETSDHVSG